MLMPDFKFEYKDWECTLSSIESSYCGRTSYVWKYYARNNNDEFITKQTHIISDKDTVKWVVKVLENAIDSYGKSKEAYADIKV